MDTMQKPATGSQVPMSPDDMLVALRMGKKMSYEVRMGNLTIPMRVLSLDEEASIRRESVQVASLKGGDETDKNIAVQKATIKMATTMQVGGVPFLTDIVLNKMTADEHSYLYNEYIIIRDRVNPSLEQIAVDEFKALVECLKKNILSPKDLSLAQLRAICTTFQDLIQRQETQTLQPDS